MKPYEKELAGILDLLRDNPRGLTVTEVSEQLGMNRNSTGKYLSLLLVSGEVDVKEYGKAKVYRISQRVPLSAMLSFTSDFILMLDRDLRIVKVNDPLLAFIGMTSDELVGKRVDHYTLPGISTSEMSARIREALDGKESRLEVIVGRDEGPRTFRTKIMPTVFDDGGQGVTVILEDITEQVRAESALAESESHYRAIVEDQNELICRFLPDAHLSLTFGNGAFSRFLGKKGKTTIGKSFLSLIPKEDRTLVAESIASLDARNPALTVEHRICGRNGQIYWYQWNYRAIAGDHGMITGYQAVGRDVTELKKKEEELQEYRTMLEGLVRERTRELLTANEQLQSEIADRKRADEALQQANTKLSLMNRVTRHDILNKLTLLLTHSELAKEHTGDHAVMTQYIAQVESIASVIKKQIEFTRDYQNMGARKPEYISADESVAAAAASLDLGGVALESDLVGVSVYADPLLEKVFYNLIDNALKHGGGVGTIRFSHRLAGKDLVVECSDDGIGVPYEEKERIFEREFGKNSGYGLFLIREILGITGMTIRETGIPGTGARFEITVPEGKYRIDDGGASAGDMQ